MVVGATAGYSALGRATARLAEAQIALSQRVPTRCREEIEVPSDRTTAESETNARCTLPERCEYDTVSRTCRETSPT